MLLKEDNNPPQDSVLLDIVVRGGMWSVEIMQWRSLQWFSNGELCNGLAMVNSAMV